MVNKGKELKIVDITPGFGNISSVVGGCGVFYNSRSPTILTLIV